MILFTLLGLFSFGCFDFTGAAPSLEDKALIFLSSVTDVLDDPNFRISTFKVPHGRANTGYNSVKMIIPEVCEKTRSGRYQTVPHESVDLEKVKQGCAWIELKTVQFLNGLGESVRAAPPGSFFPMPGVSTPITENDRSTTYADVNWMVSTVCKNTGNDPREGSIRAGCKFLYDKVARWLVVCAQRGAHSVGPRTVIVISNDPFETVNSIQAKPYIRAVCEKIAMGGYENEFAREEIAQMVAACDHLNHIL